MPVSDQPTLYEMLAPIIERSDAQLLMVWSSGRLVLVSLRACPDAELAYACHLQDVLSRGLLVLV